MSAANHLRPDVEKGCLSSGTTTIVTLTVTSVSGVLPQASKGALAFITATSITDGGGNAAAGTFTTGTNFKLF